MKILIFDVLESKEQFNDSNGNTCTYLYWRTSNAGKPTYMREKKMKRCGVWGTTSKSYAATLDAKKWHSKLSDCVK